MLLPPALWRCVCPGGIGPGQTRSNIKRRQPGHFLGTTPARELPGTVCRRMQIMQWTCTQRNSGRLRGVPSASVGPLCARPQPRRDDGGPNERRSQGLGMFCGRSAPPVCRGRPFRAHQRPPSIDTLLPSRAIPHLISLFWPKLNLKNSVSGPGKTSHIILRMSREFHQVGNFIKLDEIFFPSWLPHKR